MTRTTDPTPEEIAIACEEIRSEWDAERWRRAEKPEPPVEIQMCRFSRESDRAMTNGKQSR
jgi:hypothetical protein